METLPNIVNIFSYQQLALILSWAFWQGAPSGSPPWLRYTFLAALIITMILYLVILRPPPPPIAQALGIVLVLAGGLLTTALFFVLLFNINPFPFIRHSADLLGLGQLVSFDAAFQNGLPDALAQNIEVVSVVREDTDADGFNEWVVFYLFDKRAINSPIHGAVYDNDRGNPPVIFPYQLQAPDRNYLSEQQVFGPNLTIQELAVDHNGPNNSDVPELIIHGGSELTIFRHRNNSEPWDFPRDAPARYQAIGFFRSNGGVSINLIQGSPDYGRVTVIDRNGYERSQLAVRSVYGLVTGPDGNETYLNPIPPLGGVGQPELAAPIISTVDFNPIPPEDIFNTPFPEKIVLGFYASTCSGQNNTLCTPANTALGWQPREFLAGDALSNFDGGNPTYFGLPGFADNQQISITQLKYYPGCETDPDLFESGNGRDVVTGEQAQHGVVDMTFNVNGGALQNVRYEMGLVEGRWKIFRFVSPNEPLPCERATVTAATCQVQARPNPAVLDAASRQVLVVVELVPPSIDPSAAFIPFNPNENNDIDPGDGGGIRRISGQRMEHYYNRAGTYTLTARTESGVACDEYTLTVTDPPCPQPTANAGGPYDAWLCSGQAQVNFSGAGSDPENRSLTYAWDFGDGSQGSGQDVSHNYAATGIYNAVLTVANDCGSSDTATAEVRISAPPPANKCDQSSCCW